MDVVKNKKKCCGCHACYNVCPVQAIEMHEDEEGFLYPVILQEKCIQCNQCKVVCPTIQIPKILPLESAYGCYAKKQEERMSSSSGGIFAVIARKVLLQNGIVCGAAYDDEQAVYHLIIDKESELYRLKETKYVQSRIGNSYKEIKKALDLKRQVLFSGTPCQVAGLKNYLKKEYENLLCLELICHGVPSPGVWKRYLQEVAGQKQIEKVMFRNKSRGIAKITLDYYLSDGSVIKENYAESLYMKGFLQNIIIRPSCFECKFKGTKRCSDLTIGDFWAVKEYYPKFSDEKGISTVIVHSKKGKKWLEQVRNDLQIIEISLDEVSCWNESLLVPASKNPRREEFFSKWNNQKVIELLEILTKNHEKKSGCTIISKVRRYIRKCFK